MKVEDSIELNISCFKICSDKNEKLIDEKETQQLENIGIEQSNTNFNNYVNYPVFIWCKKKKSSCQ